jgi:hypothetical protein
MLTRRHNTSRHYCATTMSMSFPLLGLLTLLCSLSTSVEARLHQDFLSQHHHPGSPTSSHYRACKVTKRRQPWIGSCRLDNSRLLEQSCNVNPTFTWPCPVMARPLPLGRPSSTTCGASSVSIDRMPRIKLAIDWNRH